MKKQLFNINTIYINTPDFEGTANFFIRKMGFLIQGYQIHRKGLRKLDLTDTTNSLDFRITEVINFENAPKIQIGLSLIDDSSLSEILSSLLKQGCTIKEFADKNNHLGMEYYALSIHHSLPEFVIKVNEIDFDQYFENMQNSDPESRNLIQLIEMLAAYECTPIISAELLDIGFRVSDLEASVDFLRKLGFDFKIVNYNNNQFARATDGLLYLIQDDTVSSKSISESVIFIIDTAIHSEFDGKVYTNYDMPCPSFRYLKENGFNFTNNVFNSEGETISNVGYVTDLNGLTWEMRSWTKVEEPEDVV